MVVAQRACIVFCLAAAFLAGRPAAAAMKLVFRDGSGQTRTFYQEGSRVRVANLTGTDDGEDVIVDLQSDERIVVYDDAKAYFDFNKAIALMRPLMEKAVKASGAAARRQRAVSYRSLHQTRNVNGYSCDVYERVVARRVDAEMCFALWGDAIGQAEDYAWLEALAERLAADIAGKTARPAVRSRDKEPGLPVWQSSIEPDGTRDVMEIVTISRDPLPPAMFKLPADYKEIAKPLSPSERRRPPPVSERGARAAANPLGAKFSGVMAIVLVVAFTIGILVHTIILHLAASIVIDRARFLQALIAAMIIWAVMAVVQLADLPPILALPVSAFAAFAALKMSYGASIGRTLGLFLVSGLITALAVVVRAMLFR